MALVREVRQKLPINCCVTCGNPEKYPWYLANSSKSIVYHPYQAHPVKYTKLISRPPLHLPNKSRECYHCIYYRFTCLPLFPVYSFPFWKPALLFSRREVAVSTVVLKQQSALNEPTLIHSPRITLKSYSLHSPWCSRRLVADAGGPCRCRSPSASWSRRLSSKA